MSALREDDRNEMLHGGPLETQLGVVRFLVCRAKSKMIDRKLKPPVVSKSLTRSERLHSFSHLVTIPLLP